MKPFRRRDKPPPPPPMPERAELIHGPSGKSYPLVARYMHYDEERQAHLWMMVLHPDVDGDVTGRTGELGFRGILRGDIGAVLGFEFVDDDHEIVRVMRFDEFAE